MENKSNSYSEDQSDWVDSELNLKEYFFRYLRYWFLFPIFIFLALTAAFFYLQIKQPVYSTKTSILIKDEKKGISGSQGDILSELSTQFGGNKLVENELEIIKSQTLMEQVIKELSLDTDYSS